MAPANLGIRRQIVRIDVGRDVDHDRHMGLPLHVARQMFFQIVHFANRTLMRGLG